MNPTIDARLLSDDKPKRVIVLHRAGATHVTSRLGIRGVRPERTHYEHCLIPARTVTVTRMQLEDLLEHPDVVAIVPDVRVTIPKPPPRRQREFSARLNDSATLLDVRRVWESGITGDGIRVGIIDTGIDAVHADFAGRIAARKNFTAERNGGDGHGHGTHVAGIIGGAGEKYRGVAFGCAFVIAKALGSDGGGAMSDIIAALEWVVAQQCRVVNLSLGLDENGDGTDVLSMACDAVVARGVTVCVAAGNAGPELGSIGIPAVAKDVIAVGATTKQDALAEFSSRGPTMDGREGVSICFPGVDIISCRAAGTSMGMPYGSKYTSASGTSMATPFAAGTAALMLQAKPTLTPTQVRAVLAKTARDLGLTGNEQGAGRAVVSEAVWYGEETDPGEPVTPEPEPALPDGCIVSTAKALLGGVRARAKSHPPSPNLSLKGRGAQVRR